MPGFISQLVKFAGETSRIKKEKNQENELDPLSKQRLEILMQRAHDDDVQSMLDLGILYIQGRFVGYDPDMARYWWEKAAQKGSVHAQYNLGLLYHGELSTYYFDPNLAGYWFNIARYNGMEEADQIIESYYKYKSSSDKWVRIK
ncbi:MAG: hypothetical protein Q4B37_02435 [Eubacteriales bacterium]|nr:hypothetical protein [Eubacteriales bacterium]